MKLITSKTTVVAFSNQDEWLIKEPKTGAVYRMKIGRLYGDGYFLRVKQSIYTYKVIYVKQHGQQGVLITNKSGLLSVVRSKQFYIG